MSKAITIRLPETSAVITIDKKWVEERDRLLEAAKDLAEVNDNETFAEGGERLKQITKMSNLLEEMRLDFSRPFLQAQKVLIRKTREARELLEAEKSRIQSLMNGYAEEQRRLREAEEQRIEEERQRKIAEEIAQREADRELFGEDEEAEEEVVVEAEIAPTIDRPRNENVRMMEHVSFEIADEDAVPRAFCSIDERKIRAWQQEHKDRIKDAVRAGKASELVPGLTFRVESKVASR